MAFTVIFHFALGMGATGEAPTEGALRVTITIFPALTVAMDVENALNVSLRTEAA